MKLSAKILGSKYTRNHHSSPYTRFDYSSLVWRLPFYDFPAEHWLHIRTTNPIESVFATVRLRTNKTKNCGSRKTTLTMAYMLILTAQKKWRRLRG